MPENGMPGPVCDLSSVREAVCIHTHKIFDSCRDKDCVEDLRFYPTAAAQEVLSASQMIKGGTAEGLHFSPATLPLQLERLERDTLPSDQAAQLSLFDPVGEAV